MAAGGPRRAMEVFIRANAGDEAYETWLAATGPAYRERLFGNAATFFAIELLNDVDGDVVGRLFEDRGKVFDADAVDELADLFVFDVFEELADDVGGQVVKEGTALVVFEGEDEVGKVSGVKGGNKRNGLHPVPGFDEGLGVVPQFPGDNLFCHWPVSWT